MRPIIRRRRTPGSRANRACVNCKGKKLKCDEKNPTCTHCQRLQLTCLVEDPDTKRHRPRNYIETLERRLALLERYDPESTSSNSPKTTPILSDNRDSASSSRPTFASENGISPASELPARMGFLDVQAGQIEPQYLGSSSAFAFAHIVNSSLRIMLPEEPWLGERPFGRGDSTPPLPCLLPDLHVANLLSSAYFENIHTQYPFLHEPTFRRYEEQLGEPDCDFNDLSACSTPLFFVNMVYAVGALLVPEYRHLAEQLYSSAQLNPEVLSLDNLEAIQAILCYAMYSLRSAKGPSLWKLSGLALRQCIELGYHRTTKPLQLHRDPLQVELRKRAFWCAQGIDCANAIRLGRPLGIQLDDIDADLPLDIGDALISSTGIHGSPRKSPQEPTSQMSNPIHVIRLRCIWARIHTSLNSAAATNRLSKEERDARIAQLRADLEDWLATAPEPLPRTGNVLSIFCSKYWFDLNYSGTILLLYRHQLGDKSTPENVFVECMQAAGTVCRLYRRQYIGTLIKATWGTIHCLFLAGLTYLHCLWTCPSACQSLQYHEVSKTCMDCTMVLVVIAEAWEGAAPYRDIFELLASHTLSMIVNRSQQSQAMPKDSMLADNSERETVSKWILDMENTGMCDSFDDLLARYIDESPPYLILETDL